MSAQKRARSPRNATCAATRERQVVDDPCWGGPDQHDLIDLLGILNRSQSVLHECDNYIVLDKPPDLRMDGPFPSTVHKLLTYWYPPDSLAGSSNLLEAVSLLEKHNDVKDKSLRPCHQLDYATSGVLLMARTKEAAAAACRSFYHRQAQKKYLALLHGNLQIDRQWPLISRATVEETFPSEEQKYRKTKGPKAKKGTFVGYLPPPAVFLKYRSWLKTNQQKSTSDALCKKRQRREQNKAGRNTVMDPAEFELLCRDCLTLTQEEKDSMLEQKWSGIRSNPELKLAFENLADRYNNIMKAKQEIDDLNESQTLPTMFRVEEEQGEQAFYINAELAEVKNDFRVRLRKQVYPNKEQTDSHDDSVLDFKPALTRCVILARGTLNGKPVTKVRLEPRSGRRHQLRLHMVASGHTIVGDVTYEFPNDPPDISRRMCLHAHSLSMPTLKELCATPFFVAPDPFIIDLKQQVTIVGPGGGVALDA